MFALSLPALLFSAACGLALAGADYFRKAVPATVPTATVLFWFLFGQLPLLGAWLVFSGGPMTTPTALGARYWVPALSDIAASLIGNALFIVAVRRSPLSMVVPLLALIPVLTLALGWLVLGEAPAPRQIVGVLVVALGVFILYLPHDHLAAPAVVWRNFRREPGALPMLAVAVAWAMTAPLDKLAVEAAGVALHGVIQVAGLWLAVAGWLLAVADRGAFRLPRPARGPVLGAALTAGASYALQLAAYAVTLVAFAESLKRIVEIGAALAIGALAFRERISRSKLAGIALLALGVPLMLVPASG